MTRLFTNWKERQGWNWRTLLAVLAEIVVAVGIAAALLLSAGCSFGLKRGEPFNPPKVRVQGNQKPFNAMLNTSDIELYGMVGNASPHGLNGTGSFNMAQEPNMPVFEFHDCLGNVVGRYKQDPVGYGTEILVVPGTDEACGMIHVRKTNVAIDAQNQ
jgi:hypothetical protein